MRESLLDKQVMSSTEAPVVRMLPFCHVIKVGGRSIVDNGKKATYPLVEAIAGALSRFKLVIGTGGGARAAHVTAIGMDLGLPTGALAQLRIIDALGNAHMLGTLLAPHGVVAIPPEILGHMLPFFIKSAPGVICYGCATHTLIKDVDGLYDADPKTHRGARFIKDITVAELKELNLRTLPFDRVLLDLLASSRQVKRIQIINGMKPHLLEPALRGEHVGTIIRKDASA